MPRKGLSKEIDMATIPHYRVRADRETGDWVSDPEYVGDVDRAAYLDRRDTDAEHYDTYEAEIQDDSMRPRTETRAVTVVWVG